MEPAPSYDSTFWRRQESLGTDLLDFRTVLCKKEGYEQNMNATGVNLNDTHNR